MRFQRKLEDRSLKSLSLRILVVDDEPSILELVKTALEKLENYKVTVAHSAADALDKIEEAVQPFDCFLLDIQMPDVDGIKLLMEVRATPEYTDTPVIMLTAMSDRKYIDDAFLEGATDYVSKPFDFFELRSRIKCAHRLVEARQKAEPSRSAASELNNKISAKSKALPKRVFNFKDPLMIDGISRILRDVEFDNYFEQLARHKLLKSQAIAVKLQDAENLYRQEGGPKFLSAIRELAACIQMATNDLDRVFSYRGSGMFLMVVHGRKTGSTLSSLENLHEVISARIDQHLTNERIKFLVGEPIAMPALSRSRAAEALQRAVDMVEILEDDAPDFDSKKCAYGTYVYPVPRKAQKREYEKVLNELFGDESYLSSR